MIIVTGAFGFIGSNLVKELNRRGYQDLILVDDLTHGVKYVNLLNAKFNRYYDVDEFFKEFKEWSEVKTIYHQGAITNTLETDGKLLLNRNYSFTRKLLNQAIQWRIPISYASSASVYGNKQDGSLNPLNLYAYSKMLVDNLVDNNIDKFTIIHGWRYFNVYGHGEDHKGNMRSPISKFKEQIEYTGYCEIFEGSNNCYRDFVCVDDVVNVVINSIEDNLRSGIRDLGSGKVESFSDVATLIIEKYGGDIRIVPFPDNLKNGYQYFTQAEKSINYEFKTLSEWLKEI